MKNFREKLKAERKNKGITQIGLSEMTGISQPTIYRYEKGLGEPQISEVQKLASALGVSVSYLMGGEAAGDDGRLSAGVGEKVLFVDVIGDNIRACCGEGNIYPDDIQWDVVGHYPILPTDLLGYTWQAQPGDFAIIRAENDSMEPHIYDGQMILFVKCPVVEPISGDFVLLQWCDRLMIRAIEFEGPDKINLTPANEKYKSINTHRRDPRLCILGKVLGEATGIRKLTGIW